MLFGVLTVYGDEFLVQIIKAESPGYTIIIKPYGNIKISICIDTLHFISNEEAMLKMMEQ